MSDSSSPVARAAQPTGFWGPAGVPISPNAQAVAEPDHIAQVGTVDVINVATDAQSLLAHVRAIEASFLHAVNGLGKSPALDHAKTAMMAARQWVVTHLTI